MLKKESLLRLCFIALAAVPAVLGWNVDLNYTFLGGDYGLVKSLIMVAILVLAAYFAFSLPEKHLRFPAPGEEEYRPDYRLFFLAGFVINLVYLLAYYPGVSYWDTWYQIADFFDGTKLSLYEEGGQVLYTAFLNDHHPLMCAFLFSAFVMLGDALGAARIGVFIYGLLQCALYSFVAVKVLKCLRASGAFAQKLCRVYYLFNPFLSYYAICMSKDSIFSALFVLYMIEYINAFFGHSKKGGKDSFSAALLLYSLIIPLVKKTGIYIVILSNLVLLIKLFLSGSRSALWKKPAMSILLPALLMFVLFPQFIFPLINVYPGGKQELYATLFQQTALVKLADPEAYSPEEVKIIDAVFDYDAIEENYDKNLTDPIKNSSRLSTVTDQQMKDYFRLWLRTGLKYPGAYLKATFSTCMGYFAPIQRLEVYTDNVHVRPMSDPPIFLFSPDSNVLRDIDLSLTGHPLACAAREVLYSLFYWLCYCPLTALFSYLAVYTWWIPLCGTYFLLRRRGFGSLFCLSPLYISILTLIVSPYSYARYILSFVMLAPLVLFSAAICPEDMDGQK